MPRFSCGLVFLLTGLLSGCFLFPLEEIEEQVAGSSGPSTRTGQDGGADENAVSLGTAATMTAGGQGTEPPGPGGQERGGDGGEAGQGGGSPTDLGGKDAGAHSAEDAGEAAGTAGTQSSAMDGGMAGADDACDIGCEAGTTRCQGLARETCADWGDGCLKWRPLQACDDGCDAGECCWNECVAGARQCVDAGVKVCGDFDDDSCVEWGPVSACSAGGCEGGECLSCAPEGAECASDADCCSADGALECWGERCRSRCETDEDCPGCCAPGFDGDEYIGRLCGYSEAECASLTDLPVGYPCGGDSQCASASCTDAGFCGSGCTAVPSVCGVGLRLRNACVATTLGGPLRACFPTCDGLADCEPFLGTECLPATSVDGFQVGICALP